MLWISKRRLVCVLGVWLKHFINFLKTHIECFSRISQNSYLIWLNAEMLLKKSYFLLFLSRFFFYEKIFKTWINFNVPLFRSCLLLSPGQFRRYIYLVRILGHLWLTSLVWRYSQHRWQPSEKKNTKKLSDISNSWN